MLCDVIENAKLERERLFTQGKEEGKLEGILEGKLEAARKMLKENLPIDLIIKITGLSREQIDMLIYRRGI